MTGRPACGACHEGIDCLKSSFFEFLADQTVLLTGLIAFLESLGQLAESLLGLGQLGACRRLIRAVHRPGIQNG